MAAIIVLQLLMRCSNLFRTQPVLYSRCSTGKTLQHASQWHDEGTALYRPMRNTKGEAADAHFDAYAPGGRSDDEPQRKLQNRTVDFTWQRTPFVLVQHLMGTLGFKEEE